MGTLFVVIKLLKEKIPLNSSSLKEPSKVLDIFLKKSLLKN